MTIRCLHTDTNTSRLSQIQMSGPSTTTDFNPQPSQSNSLVTKVS